MMGSLLRSGAQWAMAWGVLGAMWMFSGPSVADVMSGGEMWPIMAIAGVVVGFGAGGVYGATREMVAVHRGRPAPVSKLARRRGAALHGMAVGLAMGLLTLLTTAGLLILVIMTVLCGITAFLLPGKT